MQKTINFTDARDRLPELMNMAYFENKSFLVTRRGIPMIKIIKVDTVKKAKVASKKTIANALKSLTKINGIWNDPEWKDKSSIEIVDYLRTKAWNSHAH